MYINNKPGQSQDKAVMNNAVMGLKNQQHSRHQTLGEKIDSYLHIKKAEINADMIEKFYFHLLPITYRDWIRK